MSTRSITTPESASPVSADRGYGTAPAGYRLPDATRLGRVQLQVADLGRSLRYYEGVLGFRVTSRAGNVAVLTAHGDVAPLVELHERTGARAVPRRGRLGLFHFAILLPHRGALGRFVRHLAEIEAPAGMSDHYVSEAIYLTDPDGLGIEVYADRPRSVWRHSGRQLEMATVPLDVRDLVAAGGDEAWRGMPSGTVIGHVHLHVGDLDDASAFYHDAMGFDKVVWSYPGALFLSAGGYHHHLGTNTWAAGAQPATEEDARLLEWEVVLPDAPSAAAAARSMELAGHMVERVGDDAVVRDPWGTAVRLRSASRFAV